jgi:hypothetical protein
VACILGEPITLGGPMNELPTVTNCTLYDNRSEVERLRDEVATLRVRIAKVEAGDPGYYARPHEDVGRDWFWGESSDYREALRALEAE